MLEEIGGRIVAISGADTVGYIPTHGLLAAAKSSMEILIRYLAAELGPTGVTAVGVLLGYIDTDSIRLMTGPLYESLKQAEETTHPLREAASPQAAAEAVALMCLPEAWLNGQIVQNDGGGLYAMQARSSRLSPRLEGRLRTRGRRSSASDPSLVRHRDWPAGDSISVIARWVVSTLPDLVDREKTWMVTI